MNKCAPNGLGRGAGRVLLGLALLALLLGWQGGVVRVAVAPTGGAGVTTENGKQVGQAIGPDAQRR